MEELKTDELKKVEGGFDVGIGAVLISIGIPFIAGIIDGFVRPPKCN